MADNPLTKLPLAGQLGVAALVAALMGLGFWYFYWDQAVKDEDAKKKQLATLGDEIRALEVIRNKQQEFLREVEQRKAKLELLKRILPADKETPELMKKVQYLATQANLNIRKFNPGPTTTKQFEVTAAAKPGQPGQPQRPAPVTPPKPGTPGASPPPPQDAYQEWPINVDFDGTYHSFGVFLDKVSRLSRLVNVGNIKIKSLSAPRPSRTIDVQCVATTYVYVEAPPQPAAPGPPGAAKPPGAKGQ
jgi:type IV pilus assembly protein PilO